MAYRRNIASSSAHQVYGSEGSREEVVGQSIRREVSEGLRHQLRLEREVKTEMERSDYFFTVAAIAFFGGLGVMAGSALSGRAPRESFRKSSSRGRRGGS